MARKTTGGLMVRRRKDGRVVYAMRFRALGKRRCITLGTSAEGWTKAKAEEELQNVIADVRRGLWVPPKRWVESAAVEQSQAEPTFLVFASEWFAARKTEWRENTRLDYGWQLECHLLPFFGHFPLSEITVELVDKYKTAQLDVGRLSPTSINKTLVRLGQVLAVAEEYGYIDRNPAKGRGRRVKVTPPPRTYLDRADQIEALLDAAGELDRDGRGPRVRRPLLATLTFAGLRLGEALNLRWRDVDLASGCLKVVDSKTPAGVRDVDLLPVLRDELAVLKAASVDISPSNPVFATGNGRPQSQSNVRNRMLAGAVKLANERRQENGLPEIPQGLTPHSLRRTAASLLLATGEEIVYVMAMIGHSDPTVTLRLYAKLMVRKDGERERLRRLVTGEVSDRPSAGDAHGIRRL